MRWFAVLRAMGSSAVHYGRVARGKADESLSLADDAEPFEMAGLLLLSLVVAIPLAGLLAVLEAYTTTSQHFWVRAGGLGPSLLIGLVCLSALTVTAIRAEASPAPERLFAVSMIAVVPGTMVALLGTSGLFTAFATRAEPVGATAGDFWDALLYFTWSVVDSIPVLQVSELTGWTQTPPSAPDLAGWMALGLRLVLLVPLVRVLVASYGWARNRHRTSKADIFYDDRESVEVSAMVLGWLVLAACLTAAYLRWVAATDSTVPRYVGEWIPDDVTVLSRTVDLTWAPAAVQWACLAVILWFGGILLIVFIVGAVSNRTFLAMWILLLDLLVLIGTGTLLAALLLDRLVHSGVGEVSPDLTEGAGIGPSLECLTWPLVDALPLVGATHVLGWEVDHSFDGVLVGLVQVGYRLAMLGALVTIPWMLVNLSRRESEPSIHAAEKFVGHLRSIAADLDAARNAPVEGRRKARAASRASVRRHLGRLSIVSRELERVYGYGEVSRAADLAIEAARKETATTFGVYLPPSGDLLLRRRGPTPSLEQATTDFREAVVRQHREAEPGPPATAPRRSIDLDTAATGEGE